MSNPVEFRDAMSSSTKLLQERKDEQALELLDGAIEQAVKSGEHSWVRTLCHHAAVIAKFTANRDRAKRYYEQSLACNLENARALYGLAEISREEGQIDTAREYARRSYVSLTTAEADPQSRGWLELILKNWPEVAEK